MTPELSKALAQIDRAFSDAKDPAKWTLPRPELPRQNIAAAPYGMSHSAAVSEFGTFSI